MAVLCFDVIEPFWLSKNMKNNNDEEGLISIFDNYREMIGLIFQRDAMLYDMTYKMSVHSSFWLIII